MTRVLTGVWCVWLTVGGVPAWGAGGGCDWSGGWSTSRGKMTLVQAGNAQAGANVTGKATVMAATAQGQTGSISFEDLTITAVVLGDKLAGTWSKPPSYGPPHDAGDIEFVMAPDGRSFSGQWRYGYGSSQQATWEGSWTGKRTGAASSPAAPPKRVSVCASAKPSFTSGSVFTHGIFTLGGDQPQQVRVSQSASNFAIKKAYGGLVYQVIDGKSWGSLLLEPGDYVLSCNGGGAMGTMSATACLEYVDEGAGATVTPPGGPPGGGSGGGGPGQPNTPPAAGNQTKPPVSQINPALPFGPVKQLVVRPAGSGAGPYTVQKKAVQSFAVAWGVDEFGHKIGGLTAEKWSVDDKAMGTIDAKSGELKVGNTAGQIKVKAEARNRDGEWVSGVVTVMIAQGPLTIFKGKAKLFDQNMNPVNPAGVRVELGLALYENAAQFGKANSTGEFKTRTWTNSKGTFKFAVPSVIRGKIIGGYGVDLFPPASKLNTDYVWKAVTDKWTSDGVLVKAGSTLNLTPINGGTHFTWKMVKADTVIVGRVTHHRKPHTSTKVSLVRHGKEATYGWSDDRGVYTLYVDGLPPGRYILTAEHRPEDFGDHTTIHNWLKIRKPIEVDLPLKGIKTTIDVEVLSWGEKVGYTGP